MKSSLLFLLFLGLIGDNLNKAGKVNNQVSLARNYYQEGQYQKAAGIYNYLIDSLDLQDPEILLNLAHATFLNGQNAKARIYYTKLAKLPDPELKSVAFTQLGILFFQRENPERALYHFRKALIENNLNESARYNYELVKKHLLENPSAVNPKKNSSQKNKPENKTSARSSDNGSEGTTPDNNQQDKTNTNQQPAPGESEKQNASGGGGKELNKSPNLSNKGNNAPAGNKGNVKGINEEGETNLAELAKKPKPGTEGILEQERQMQTLRARLRTSDLSPEKATMLLEAIRQAELQYLQQVPKPVKRNEKKNGPDW